MRPSMEQVWMELALTLTKRSTCKRLQVGAVITSQDLERVYSVGYNGGAKGQDNRCVSNTPGQCGHIHAEENALIKCFVYDPDKVIFVTNLPCAMCAKKMVNSKFSKIYYRNDYRNHESIKILKQAGIKVIKI